MGQLQENMHIYRSFNPSNFTSYVEFILGCNLNTYGDDCKLTCGYCKDNVTCNSINGICSDGCADGWFGEKCDTSKYCICITMIFQGFLSA